MAKKQVKQADYNPVVYNTVFEEVMHNSMLPYSESVILDRALPRVEDGLKPVQRRILYSMHEMGLTPDKPYKKSARIVGDCLGKYHPHGDSSVYGAMVRMAQPFSMRMKLVDGHGNFGSVDGDSPAAMRYTEARMSPLALELLRDLDKDTVTWSPNFDDSLEEPNMLPGRFPNLLVNGAGGIAVGIATNIPTHNMGESIDAVLAAIDNPRITTKELLKVFKGPDFPTGGFIVPVDSLEEIYETGRGRIKIRSRLHIEDDCNGKQNIVITEMPYQVSKADLLTKIAELRDNNKELLQGISEIVDESDKNGMRAVIRCKKETDVNKVVKFLFKKTNLEVTFAINMVAIANGKPELLGLKDILKYYIEYQRQVVVRRADFDLKAAKARAEIVNGLLVAIANIDEVIKIIKTSETTAKAKQTLRDRFDLSDVQAQAILDMRLKALARLEVGRLEDELKELDKRIKYLSALLGSKTRQYEMIKEELSDIKRRMNSERMSVIVKQAADGEDFEVPSEEEAVEYRDGILMTDTSGGMRFMSQKVFSLGRKDMSKYTDKELPVQALSVNNKGTLLAFTNMGNSLKVNVTELPEKKWKEKPFVIGSLNPEISVGERVVKLMFFDSTPAGEFVFFTKGGMVKRTDVAEFSGCRDFGAAINLNEGDELINVELFDEDKNVFEVSKQGLVLVYSPDEISCVGRKAAGVRGIKLNDGDSVAYGGLLDEEGEIVIFASSGHVKRVISSTIDIGSRYNKGVRIMALDNNAEVVFVDTVKMPYDLAVSSGETTSILNTEDIRIDTRTTRGKQLFKAGVSAVVKID